MTDSLNMKLPVVKDKHVKINASFLYHLYLTWMMNADSFNKKLRYRQGTTRCAVLVKTVLSVAQMFIELHLISPA